LKISGEGEYDMKTAYTMPLFSTALSKLDHASIRRNHVATTPTNQQILDAAQQAYAAHQPAVDALTTAGSTYSSSQSGIPQINQILQYNWTGQKVDSSLVIPVWQDAGMRTALNAIINDGAFGSVDAGVLNALAGHPGGVEGIANTLNIANFVGVDVLTSGVFPTPPVNLFQVGAWTSNPGQLAASPLYALLVEAQVAEQTVILLIALRQDLSTYGFSIAYGADIEFGSLVVSGSAKLFGDSQRSSAGR
jgi:hypothetical protein